MNSETAVTGLLVNHLRHAFGVVSPSFAWKMESTRQGAAQAAYRLRVFEGRDATGAPVWDSGEVAGHDSFAIRYAGPALKSAHAYSWRVAVLDETGVWTESKPAVFETGLLDPAAWEPAKWIAVVGAARHDRHTSAFFRRVVNAGEVREAWWFVTALGVFEAYVGPEPVSHRCSCGGTVRDALKPGFTHCLKRRHYFSYDVTHLLDRAAGAANTLTALVTNGWWNEQITGFLGKENAFRGILVLRYADGTEETVATDETWLAGYAGPVARADIFYGEDFDARADAEWRKHLAAGEPGPGFAPARTIDEFRGETVPLKGLPVRQRDDIALAPASIRVWSGIEGADESHYGRIRVVREYRDGDEMKVYPGENLQIDFGQNAAAVPDFAFAAARGTVLTARVSEMLNDCGGAFDRKNDGPEGELYKRNYREARSEARYTFVGDAAGETYRPQFTFFGYRYLSISATNVVTVRRVRSIPVTSVAKCAETGMVETSDPILNRLIANGVWGQRSNYLSVPTDCPQRNERLGWAADTQVFSPTACYNAEVYSFLSKWMDDMADSQHDDGGYPGVAPLAQYGDNNAAVGWADAGIIVPHVLWRMFGDTSVIDDHYDSMAKYMALLDRQEGPNPEPWGEWLAYERNDVEIKCYLTAAFWVWDAMLMQRMAAATGRADDAARWAASETRARAAFKAKYLDAGGEIRADYRCQAADLYALYLDLVSGDAFEATRRDLLDNIRAHGDCLQTGFLGTAIIMDTLVKVGAADVAYTLLLQRKNPSWLYSIDQGATTFWERWNSYTKETGFGEAGMNSFNHYAYGAVIAWLYSSMAGIRVDPAAPGFRHFILQPLPDRRVGSVRVAYDSAGGLVESAWEYGADGVWTWRYAIPANTSATVVLPDGTRLEQAAGHYSVTLALPSLANGTSRSQVDLA